jgi:hypothetical protein
VAAPVPPPALGVAIDAGVAEVVDPVLVPVAAPVDVPGLVPVAGPGVVTAPVLVAVPAGPV